MSSFMIRVPASTANVGPGFDVIGIALSLYLELQVETFPLPYIPSTKEKLLITYEEKATSVPLDHTNLIIQSCLHLLHRQKVDPNEQESVHLPAYHDLSLLPVSMRIHVINPIPLARGMGSSASAIVAGVLLGDALGGFGLSKDSLFDYILELEGHPDNVGASLFGGVIAGFIREPTDRNYENSAEARSNSYKSVFKRHRCGYVQIPYNKQIRAICVVPDFELSTKVAREVLPNNYARTDVIFNLQRIAVLLSSLSSNPVDRFLLHDVLSDKLHQPYRMHLIPGLKEILETLTPYTVDGLIGITLSGAGPTVLALVVDNFELIGKSIQSVFAEHSITSSFQILEISQEGACVDKSIEGVHLSRHKE